jgi:hypothetical protein
MNEGRDSIEMIVAPGAKPALQPTLDRTLHFADRHLQAGRLAAGEALCRDILRTLPNCAPALHRLGIIFCQGGSPPSAIELLRRATPIARPFKKRGDRCEPPAPPRFVVRFTDRPSAVGGIIDDTLIRSSPNLAIRFVPTPLRPRSMANDMHWE